MTVKSKIFIKYFIPFFLLSSSVFTVLSYMEAITELKTIKLTEVNNLLLKENSLKNRLSNITTDLYYLVSHYNLHDFLIDGNTDSKERIQNEFLLISKTRPFYDQIRFIDNNGMEIIRINYNNGNQEIVPDDKLQSKKDRYYIKESLNLDPGEIYASPFDLNVENGRIEHPRKPMIRFGMAVFDRTGNKKGVVIINYRGELLLKILENSTISSSNISAMAPVWLLNSESFWLKGSSPEMEWSFMYPDGIEYSFKKSFPKEWKLISETEKGQIHNSKGLINYSTIYPFTAKSDIHSRKITAVQSGNYYWKTVSFIPSAALHKTIFKLLWKYILVYILIITFMIPSILFMTREQLKKKEAEKNLIIAVETAERANIVKSKFLANMSHEIRTPMNAILGFSGLLLEKSIEGEEKSYLKAIYTSGKALMHLIDDILDLSKIEADKVEIKNIPLNIISVLDDMEIMFAKNSEGKNINFITEISGTVDKNILIDETRLRQILLNVIGNAVKFTDSGYVKISLSSAPSMENSANIDLTILVEDTGIGIPEEFRDNIFNPFEQAENNVLSKYGGTGLGLAITKKLMQLMNGRVELVEKNTPGALFRLTFFNVKPV